MKNSIVTLALILLGVMTSCQQKQSEEAKAFDSQMKKTIQIHDDVMPKMSEINSLITELEASKKEIQQEEEVDAEQVELHDSAIANLKDAHDLMMSWMKNFSNSFSRTEINKGLETSDQDSINAKVKLLDAQYKSAEEMKEAINVAIDNAQTILSK